MAARVKKLWLDYETFSPEDIFRAWAHRYCEHPAFRILLAAFALDDGPVYLWDATEDPRPPRELMEAFTEADEIIAHNAEFEILCTYYGLGLDIPLNRWTCTSAMARTLSLPPSLSDLCMALELPSDKSKDADGRRLIKMFCVPSEHGGYADIITPSDEPEDWRKFGDYCMQDVEATRECEARMPRWNWEKVRHQWELDQKINRRGFAVDRLLAEKALAIAEKVTKGLNTELPFLTQNSVTAATQIERIKQWLRNVEGLTVDSLDGKAIAKLLGTKGLSRAARRVLNIRDMAGKASIAKYRSLLTAASESDSRLRGALTFAGASRTMRWSGRLFQPQNLPRPSIKDTDAAAMLLREWEE